MKRIVIVAFVILSLLLTASCVSPPNWTGAEIAPGEFIWKQSPSIRFYVNVGIPGALILSLLSITIWGIYKTGMKGPIGCFILLILCLALLLFTNLQDNILMPETISINSERIERTYSNSKAIWRRSEKQVIEWKNINACRKFTDDQTVWLKSGKYGDVFKAGDVIKGVALYESEEKAIRFVLEKQNPSHDLLNDFIFGNDDFTVSPEEEMRLKEVINKYLPEEVKQKMSPETKEYFSKQE